jgi:hypothetical protein
MQLKIWQTANGMPKGKINAPLQPDYCIPLLQELIQGSQIKATVQRDKEPITWNLNATIDTATPPSEPRSISKKPLASRVDWKEGRSFLYLAIRLRQVQPPRSSLMMNVAVEGGLRDILIREIFRGFQQRRHVIYESESRM